MLFRKTKIQTKLIIGFAINVFIALTVGVIGYYSLNKVVTVSDLETKIFDLELAFENILANQEKYKESGRLDDFNSLNTTLNDIKGKVADLKNSDVDAKVIGDIRSKTEDYQKILLILKDNKDTNNKLLNDLKESSADMKKSFSKEIKTENDKIQTHIIESSGKFIKEQSYKSIEQIVELGFNITKYYHSGRKSKKTALETLRNINFDGNNYFFVVKSDYELIAHGARRELEGMDFSKIKDKKTGKTFMIDLVKNAVKDGSSIANYYWTRAGKGSEVFPKVTMARYFKPWDIIICAGVYIDDIDAANEDMKKIVAGGFMGMEKLNDLEKKMISARLEALYHMRFNSGKEKTVGLMKEIVEAPNATEEIKISGKDYINNWRLYADNLEKADLSAKDATDSVLTGIKIMRDMTSQVKSVMSGTESSAKSFILWFIAIGCCFAVLMGFFLIRSIIVPIKDTNEMIKDIAEGEGDLTKRLFENSYDEVGELAKWMNIFIEKLQGMIKDISSMMISLSETSKELTIVSDEIASNSNQTADKSTSVAGASEKMSSNMNSVAAASEQTTSNIQTVVAAIEEMRSTIEDISQNIAKGNETTQNAVFHAKEVSSKVDQLGLAAQEITKVTETISDISDQTNLLALNATIEAARAGDAGKGFAVVAGEIKALAQQTAVATNEINSKIGNVQETTVTSVEVIENVVKIINDIDEIVSAVSVAIEEQSATTHEISRNVTQAAEGVEEVSGSVNQTNIVADEVTKEISEVSEASSKINLGSNQVKNKASDLSKIATKLSEMVGRFKV